VIPAEFDYVVAESVDDAIAKLSEAGIDAKALAGGHSLIPLMKLRLAAPTLLVDIGKLDDLRGVRGTGATEIGALTTYAEMQVDEGLGLFCRAAGSIADQQVRNRGTIGGSLAHGDPASDMPAAVLAAEAEITIRGPGGERNVPAAEMFQNYMTTAVRDGELITSISIPDLSGFTYGYLKFTRRAEDWAMVGVSALVKANDGSCEDVRIAMTNMGNTPLRASAAEAALRGGALDRDSIAAAAEHAAEDTTPSGDLNATAAYKRHLARVLTKRALLEAAGLAD
jgi:aerobic carbon-monoxide dehydrogenase medium subunit